jgi:hypothetical protein
MLYASQHPTGPEGGDWTDLVSTTQSAQGTRGTMFSLVLLKQTEALLFFYSMEEEGQIGLELKLHLLSWCRYIFYTIPSFVVVNCTLFVLLSIFQDVVDGSGC